MADGGASSGAEKPTDDGASGSVVALVADYSAGKGS
jgi:hypothetical protein